MNFFNILFNNKYKHKGKFEEQLFAGSGGEPVPYRVIAYNVPYKATPGRLIVYDSQMPVGDPGGLPAVCKCGYWSPDAGSKQEGWYLDLYVEDNGDGTHSFIIPSDITEVVLVRAGDVTLDGRLTTDDHTLIKDYFNEVVDDITPEQKYAGDNNVPLGKISWADVTKINAVVAGTASAQFSWNTAPED